MSGILATAMREVTKNSPNLNSGLITIIAAQDKNQYFLLYDSMGIECSKQQNYRCMVLKIYRWVNHIG
jgi:hypothetical protein